MKRGSEAALWVRLPEFGYMLDITQLRVEFPNRDDSPEFYIGGATNQNTPGNFPTFEFPPNTTFAPPGWVPDGINSGVTPRTGTDMLWHGMRFFIDDRNIIADLTWVQRFPKLIVQRNPTQTVGNESMAGRFITNFLLRVNNNEYFNPEQVDWDNELVIEAGDFIDIYTKFTDIYQHLDKRHLWNQLPLAQMQEAGEFNMMDMGGVNFENPPIRPPEITG